MGTLAGVGLIGALVNATVMWGMTGATVTTSPWWSVGLTAPLVLILVVASGLLGSPSAAGRFETILRGMVLAMILLFGYIYPSTARETPPGFPGRLNRTCQAPLGS